MGHRRLAGDDTVAIGRVRSNTLSQRCRANVILLRIHQLVKTSQSHRFAKRKRMVLLIGLPQGPSDLPEVMTTRHYRLCARLVPCALHAHHAGLLLHEESTPDLLQPYPRPPQAAPFRSRWTVGGNERLGDERDSASVPSTLNLGPWLCFRLRPMAKDLPYSGRKRQQLCHAAPSELCHLQDRNG